MMYGSLSTTAMSSTRPPMLAGPMPRQTKRLSSGSCDQLTGVGVGVGVGVADGEADGAPGGGWGAVCVGVCVGACVVAGSCACETTVPSAAAHTRAKSHARPDVARDLSFIEVGVLSIS